MISEDSLDFWILEFLLVDHYGNTIEEVHVRYIVPDVNLESVGSLFESSERNCHSNRGGSLAVLHPLFHKMRLGFQHPVLMLKE